MPAYDAPMNETAVNSSPSASATEASRLLGSGRRHGLRHFEDRAAAWAISAGGMGVLVAILLIFFYLLYEIVPLFRSADSQPVASYTLPGAETGPPLHLAVEEQNEIGLRLDRSGRALFFRADSGDIVDTVALSVPEGVRVSSFAPESDQSHLLVLGLDNGSVLIAHHDYRSDYADGTRRIEPSIDYPYGGQPLELEAGQPLQAVAARRSEGGLVIVAAGNGGHLMARKWEKREDFLSGESVTEEVAMTVPEVDIVPSRLLISPDQRWLYVLANDGNYRVVDLAAGTVTDSGRFFASGVLTDARFLLGGVSILISSDRGELSQWFLVRKPDAAPQLTRIRSFGDGSPVASLVVEHRRKGFAAIGGRQQLELYYSTSQRHLLSAPLAGPVRAAAFSPRANGLLYETADGRIHFRSISNDHPEISWSVLWDEVWYESYPEPAHVWQSSSASSDFEPKYSLMPLAFGTLKAAFYAMLVATPLAICGALYTAYFMAPALRRKVKPLIELMAALPTVILGFLAGLWLAPAIEQHLPGIFSILLFMPVAVLLFAFLWNRVPIRYRRWIPEGWQPVILVPVVLVVGYLCLALSVPMESALFDGDMRAWMRHEWGLDYAQRNALVVGIAMGFAVIPNIFSIAEDAIFSVPKHLSYGSLALGATPWQTLVGVVLPTASPGIFSALMIGLGRAVGETMIVLMAAGNTAVMDANLFQGMRTLSANIAVEIGETAVDSTHFRVLFLAAFVLFMFTFVLNTAAEIIRNRLRRRYSVI